MIKKICRAYFLTDEEYEKERAIRQTSQWKNRKNKVRKVKGVGRSSRNSG